MSTKRIITFQKTNILTEMFRKIALINWQSKSVIVQKFRVIVISCSQFMEWGRFSKGKIGQGIGLKSFYKLGKLWLYYKYGQMLLKTEAGNFITNRSRHCKLGQFYCKLVRHYKLGLLLQIDAEQLQPIKLHFFMCVIQGF